MCKHTFTHIIANKCNFAWKNSEKPWFWRFLVIFVFLTWRHLWLHSGVIQGMFVLFWYQWTPEGHSYPLVPHTWYFVNRFPRSWGEESAPPPSCEMGPKSPALLGLKLVCSPWRTSLSLERPILINMHGVISTYLCSITYCFCFVFFFCLFVCFCFVLFVCLFVFFLFCFVCFVFFKKNIQSQLNRIIY